LPVFVVAVRIAHDIKDRGVVVELGFLFDGGHPQAGAARDRAVIGLRAAVQQSEERGLPCAVAADEADALAGLDGEVGMVQQRMVSVGELNVGQGDESFEGHVVLVSAASKRISAYCRRNPRYCSRRCWPSPGTDRAAVIEYGLQGGLDDRGGRELIEEGPDSTGQGNG